MSRTAFRLLTVGRICSVSSIMFVQESTKNLAEPWPRHPGHRSFAAGSGWPFGWGDCLSPPVVSGDPSEMQPRWMPDGTCRAWRGRKMDAEKHLSGMTAMGMESRYLTSWGNRKISQSRGLIIPGTNSFPWAQD